MAIACFGREPSTWWWNLSAHDAPLEERELVGRFTGLSFSVPDAQSKHQELLALGVEFTGAPEKQMWGGVLATLRDPAGNELQIVQHAAA